MALFRKKSSSQAAPTSTAHDVGAAVMSLGDHLDELRKRLFLAIIGVLPIFIVGMIFGKTILGFVVAPVEAALLNNHNSGGLLVTGLMEGVNNYIKVAALLALLLGGPWILYQIWCFVTPGLHRHEKRFIQILAPMSAVLSIAGLAFMYYIMLPVVLDFFVKFNQSLLPRPTQIIQPLPSGVSLSNVPLLNGDPPDPAPGTMWINKNISQLRIALPAKDSKTTQVLGITMQDESFVNQQYKIDQTLSLLLTFALTFALAFQTPVVVLLLGWLDILQPKTMARYRKQAMGVCLCLGALLTPPDFISWLALAVPLYLLYELGLVLVRLLPAERVLAGSFFARRAQRNSSDLTPPST